MCLIETMKMFSTFYRELYAYLNRTVLFQENVTTFSITVQH